MDINEGLNNVIRSQTTPEFLKGLELQKAWEKIAPSKALRHTDNVVQSRKFDNSVIVFVDTPHMAAELSMSKEYFRQMMEHETNLQIDDLFFIVSKKTGIHKNFEKQEDEKPWYIDDSQPVPLSDGELEYIRLSVEGIEDEKLKESLFNAFLSDMEWKKGLKGSKTP